MSAVDGSISSENAFKYVMHDLMKREKEDGVKDTLVCSSITDRKKDTYLPYNMRSHFLTDSYEAKLLGIG